jgi:CBS domain containing-hemolysin-like protein
MDDYYPQKDFPNMKKMVAPRGVIHSWATHAYILYGAWIIADKFAETFKEFPPVQKPNTFTIDDALTMMREASTGGKQ